MTSHRFSSRECCRVACFPKFHTTVVFALRSYGCQFRQRSSTLHHACLILEKRERESLAYWKTAQTAKRSEAQQPHNNLAGSCRATEDPRPEEESQQPEKEAPLSPSADAAAATTTTSNTSSNGGGAAGDLFAGLQISQSASSKEEQEEQEEYPTPVVSNRSMLVDDTKETSLPPSPPNLKQEGHIRRAAR